MKFKKVQAIRKIKKTQQVFNFSVPGPESYIANNTVVHNCYVKEHTSTEQLNTSEFIKLFRMFYDPAISECFANQITISADVVPKDDGSYLASHNRTCLIGLVWQIVHTITEFKEKNEDFDDNIDYPEVHMTFHSPESLMEYCMELPPVQLADSLDMISFSNIPDLHCQVLKQTKKLIPINYNHLIPGDLNSSNIKEYAEKIERIASVVNSIYLVIYKEPIGKEYTHADFQRQKARLQHDIAVINSLRKLLSKNAWSKVQIDGCLQDIARYKQCKQQCSSNISRFQVWPDGSVSGCAYAFRPSGNNGSRGAGSILENIRKARQYNEFQDWCYLHKVYASITR